MDEYIKRDELMRDMLHAMAGTGYQSRAMDVIRFAQAKDVEEVRHGWWLQNGMCSECLEKPSTTHKSYCPNCGAKMDR